MNKRRADLVPGDRIHNPTLLAEGMIVRAGEMFTLLERETGERYAGAFLAAGEDGRRIGLHLQPGAGVFVGWVPPVPKYVRHQ